jgi:uncharacterized protein YndB with AHSA1/START domain
MTTAGRTSPTVGLTADVGWEIGVSRTIDLPVKQVWEFLTSDDGIRQWLGGGLTLPAGKATQYSTPDGTTGEVRSFRDQVRVRLSWQPAGWDHPTTVQVAVAARGDRTMLRFHQERLADSDERARQREHWSAVLDRVIGELTGATTTGGAE